jgi:two-component system OmpR family response regulator
LPGLEYRLLRAFAEQPRRVLSRGALSIITRREGTTYPSERTIGVYIARLRRRLAAGGGEALISTVRHAGYSFEADVVRA